MLLNKNQSLFLSIIRIIACSMSFIVHYGQFMNFTSTARRYTDLGALGVCVFFIMSGFFGAQKFDLSNQFSIREYYIKRGIRILPLYYFWILVYYMLYSFLKKEVPIDDCNLYWLRYFLLLNDKLPFDYFWSNLGATWTIPIFWSFYLSMPFLSRIASCWTKSMIFFIISCPLLYFISRLWPVNIVLNLSYFISGILLYYSIKENKNNETILLMLIIHFLFHPLFKGFGLFFSLFVGIICSGLNVKFNSYFKIVKYEKIIRLLDKYTYTFYLTHYFYINVCTWLKITDRLYVTMILLLGSFITTYFVYNCIEKPIQKGLSLILLK